MRKKNEKWGKKIVQIPKAFRQRRERAACEGDSRAADR